jgi:hypothetical protein
MASKEELNRIIEYRDVLGEITKELGKKTNHIKEAVKSYTNLDSIAKQLQINEEITNTLSDKQLDKLKSKAALQIQELKRSAELLAKEKNINIDLLDIQSSREAAFKKLNNEEKALILAAKEGFKLEEESLDIINKEVETREKVNKSLGFAGNSMKILNSIAGGLGKALSMDKISTDMEKFANESIRANKEVSRLQTLTVGLKSAFKNLSQPLTDPAIIIGTIIKSFGEFEKANREVRQLTGQSADNYSRLNSSLVTGTDQIKTIGSLSKELNINVNAAFSPNTILAATELTELLGIGATESANLAMGSEAFGHNLSDIEGATESAVKNMALQGKGALNFKDVMNEAGKASKSLSVSLKGNPEALAKAAASAKALGLSLKDAESIADNLLNFESSISAEIEAELLTGKQLNLEKARTAALNNDMETLTKEIGNNQEIINSFSSGNRIQQDAIAKSLGMSKDQVAEMVLKQQLSKNLSIEQAAKAAGISVEEAKRLSIQEQIQKSIAKMTELLNPVLGFITKLLSNSIVFYGVLGAIALIVGAKLVTGFKSIANDAKDAGKSMMGMFKGMEGKKGVLENVKGGFKGFMGGDKSKEAIPGGDNIEKAAESTKGISGEQGKKISDFLKGLSEGLTAMGTTKVLFGAVNLIPASIGLIAMIPGFFGAKLLEQINGEKLQESLYGLAMGMEEMGKGKVLLGSLGLIAASVGLTAMIPGVIGGLMLAAAATPIATGLNILGASLVSFGTMMATGVGALGLALLTGAAIGLGFALKLAAPGIAAFGIVIDSVFKGIATVITAVADGFIKFLDAITLEKVGVIMSLGAALFSVAAGLGAVAIAGIAALPAIAGLTILTTIGGALGSLFGGDGEKSESKKEDKEDPTLMKLDELNTNIMKLISIVEKGGNVTMDGATVGKVLALGSSKLG